MLIQKDSKRSFLPITYLLTYLLIYLLTYLLTYLLIYLLQSCSMLCSIAPNGAARCTADISVGAGRVKNTMHLDKLAKNISSNKTHYFCSMYLSVISDLIKTHSQHITKRKTLLIDMCDRCIHPKTVSAIAQRL